ncbi:peroxidase 10 [Cajanus cajan]|uniref:Peroxidase n=1 Tax=Cajanus cajan TaxID=3821 RepID=A0A151T6D7_CAJCA|nr:peroxidase 10 [Cajanus cajan]KYP62597.1 Peroxidase 10 [Cajanus cajan]
MECISNKHSSVPFILLILLCPLVRCQLSYDFYLATCPTLTHVVRSTLVLAMFQEPRIAASLLRLHFHDCFANGCDGSVLLDDTGNFTGEKTAVPNRNSIRGFEVIDVIKYKIERECPSTVSCADILALVAREAVNLSIGPYWQPALLGRRDGTTASFNEASELPSPFDTLQNNTNKFISKGLDIKDLVVLSGAHTIGFAHCSTFKQRLFNFSGTGKPDPSLDPSLLQNLQRLCPDNSSDSNLAPLDAITTNLFDNTYYKNIVNKLGLLHTDEALMSHNITASLVIKYSKRPSGELCFYKDFDASLEKMSLIGVLTGQFGEIRKNCRVVN